MSYRRARSIVAGVSCILLACATTHFDAKASTDSPPAAFQIVSLEGEIHSMGLNRTFYQIHEFEPDQWTLATVGGVAVASPLTAAAKLWVTEVSDGQSKVTQFIVPKDGQVLVREDFLVLRRKASAAVSMTGNLSPGVLQQQQVHCRTKASIRGWTLTGSCWGTPATNPATGCQETPCQAGSGHCSITVYNTDGSSGTTSTDCGTAGAKFIECANTICWTFGNYIP